MTQTKRLLVEPVDGGPSHAADWLRRIIWEATARGEHRPQHCRPPPSHYPASRPLSRRRQTRPRVRERSKVHGPQQVDEAGIKQRNNAKKKKKNDRNITKKNWKLIICKFKPNRFFFIAVCLLCLIAQTNPVF